MKTMTVMNKYDVNILTLSLFRLKTMKKIVFLLSLLMLALIQSGFAQSDDLKFELSLQEAQDYAVQNNLSVESARYDVELARLGLSEAISAGLLNVDGSISLSDNLKLMTTLLPGEFLGMPGEMIPVKFGTRLSSSYGIQGSILLFNGPYIVGIQTASLANKLSELGVEKTEQDIREAVSMSYYLILVSEESMRVLDSNIEALNETLRSTRAMYNAGMAEETDVDQMVSNVSMMLNSKSSMERALEVNYNMLRFQLGVDATAIISLSESLTSILAGIDVDAAINSDFDLKSNVDYRLLEGNEQLSELALKMQKSTVLPTLSTFYSGSRSGMGDKFNDMQWFPSSVLGFQLSVPIFASGDRTFKIKKAKINLLKARTGKELMTEQLLLQEKQLRYNLVNAREQYRLQEKNIEVSKRIYDSVVNKYRQGMASSLEVTQANANYLQAENNYLSALISLLQSKTSLDKLLGNI